MPSEEEDRKRYARDVAQEVIATFENDKILNARPYIAIGDASTGIALIISILGGLFWIITATQKPLEIEVSNNKSNLFKMEQKMDKGFQYLAELIQAKK